MTVSTLQTIFATIAVVAYAYSLHALWASTRSYRLEASRLIDRAETYNAVAFLLWAAIFLFT
jgi:hypothetical protein